MIQTLETNITANRVYEAVFQLAGYERPPSTEQEMAGSAAHSFRVLNGLGEALVDIDELLAASDQPQPILAVDSRQRLEVIKSRCMPLMRVDLLMAAASTNLGVESVACQLSGGRLMANRLFVHVIDGSRMQVPLDLGLEQQSAQPIVHPADLEKQIGMTLLNHEPLRWRKVRYGKEAVLGGGNADVYIGQEEVLAHLSQMENEATEATRPTIEIVRQTCQELIAA